MAIDTVITFITGLGVGSLITAIVQHRLVRRAAKEDSVAKDKKDAIDGFLAAYGDIATGWSNEKAKRLALWEARIQLVCSSRVAEAIARLKKSQAGSIERDSAHSALIAAMRDEIV